MAALAPFYPVPCDRAMFKYIIRVRIGGCLSRASREWLSFGFRFGACLSGRQVRPFLFAFRPSGIKEVFLRFFWLECSISELPF